MTISTLELARARDTVRGLLDELRLEAYLFEVEPREGSWEIRVECGSGGEWQAVALEVTPDDLRASSEPGRERDSMLAAWQQALGGCAQGNEA
ncbi:hypothetical protein [Thiogranum longum]